ncbi:MAG: DUF3488 domain-containing protein [Phycisphaerae bacterium]|nr:DUF3488 domain-containing protein [Phycisphaerae bacterium]
MALLRRFPLLAYMLALLSMFGFTWATQNFSLMAFAFLATAVSWWLVEASDGPPIPRWIITFAVLVDALILACELIVFHQPNLILALGHFIVGLILCKLYEVKTNRDYGQILILTLLLVLSTAILTTSAIFAITLVCYLGLGLYVSLVFHLRCETQRALLQHAASDRAMLMIGQNPVMARDIRRIFWGSAITLFVFASFVFVLFPRSGMPGILANWRIHGQQTQTGFTNHVRLGRNGTLRQSNAIVAEISLSENGKNIGGVAYQPYFAGSILDVYDAHTREWIHSTPVERRARTYTVHAGRPLVLIPSGPHTYAVDQLIVQRVRLNLISHTANIFAISPVVTLSSHDIHNVVRQPNGMLLSISPHTRHLQYTVASPRRYNPLLLGASQPHLFPTYYSYEPFEPQATFVVRSSPIPAVVAKMARKIVGKLLVKRRKAIHKAALDEEIAARFCNYLKTNYHYSFHMTPIDIRLDPTVDFLLNKQKVGGYCEYFASAMIMFCRSVGIPARMVTGYHGGDYNRIAGYYVVRQKFAHTWVQVWIPGLGWRTFDPSPASSLTSVEAPRRWYSSIAQFFQWIRLQWLQDIVAFNAIMRTQIIHYVLFMAKTTLFAALNEVRAALMALRNWLMHRRTGWFPKIVAAAMAIISLILIGWFTYRRRRRKTSVLPKILQGLDAKTHRQLRRDLAFFDRLMRILQKTGSLKTTAQTPLEYVNQVIHTRQDVAPEAAELVHIFYELRFGHTAMNPSLHQSINARLKAVEAYFRQKRVKPI